MPAGMAAARFPGVGTAGYEMLAPLFLGSPEAYVVRDHPCIPGDLCPLVASRRVYGVCILTSAVP